MFRAKAPAKASRRCMSIWKRYHEIRMSETTRVTDKRPTKKRFALIQNGRRVEHMRKRVIMSTPYRAWRLYTRQRVQSRRLFKAQWSSTLKRILKYWHLRARFQRKLRAAVVQQWREVGVKLITVPFKRWFVWAVDRRTLRRNREMMLTAYARRKRNILIGKCFRKWSYQTVHGRTEAKHTKLELLEAISKHRRTGKVLQAALEETKGALREAQSTLQHEQREKEKVLRMLADAEERTAMMKMAVHNCEAELTLMTTIADTLISLHPGSVVALQDESLKIKDRGLAALARYIQLKKGGTVADLVEEDRAAAAEAAAAAAAAPPKPEQPAVPPEDLALLERFKATQPLMDSVLALTANNGSALEAKPAEAKSGEASEAGPKAVPASEAIHIAAAVWQSVKTGKELDDGVMIELEKHNLRGSGQLDLQRAAAEVLAPVDRSASSRSLGGEPKLSADLSLQNSTWGTFLEDVSHNFPHHPKHAKVDEQLQARAAEKRLSNSSYRDDSSSLYSRKLVTSKT